MKNTLLNVVCIPFTIVVVVTFFAFVISGMVSAVAFPFFIPTLLYRIYDNWLFIPLGIVLGLWWTGIWFGAVVPRFVIPLLWFFGDGEWPSQEMVQKALERDSSF